jgi:hypothetical protein
MFYGGKTLRKISMEAKCHLMTTHTYVCYTLNTLITIFTNLALVMELKQ